MKFLATLVVTMLMAVSSTPGNADDFEDGLQNWGQWRGPLGTGVAPRANPPIEWSETRNIRWKTALPGKGHSTPIVWRDRIFVTTAVPTGEAFKPRYSMAPGAHDNAPVTHRQQFVVVCIRRSDGAILWQHVVREVLPHEGAHFTASLASNSPVADARCVYAFFGSNGLFCHTHDGKLLWKCDFGLMQSLHGHGEGASPAIHGNVLVVNWDHEGQSFVTALDKRSGKQLWKVQRDEPTSWATPIIVTVRDKPQVIISGTNRIRGYDLATGAVAWQCGGLSSNIVASPVAANGMVFAGSSYDKRALLAIRLDQTSGDVSDSEHVAWSRLRGTPYVPSPLLYDDSLYFLTHYQGVMTRVHSDTGLDRPGSFRLSGIHDVYSSPVGAADRVYVTDREGRTLVFRHAEDPKVLALNSLDDTFSASAALVGADLILRGERHLYCISNH